MRGTRSYIWQYYFSCTAGQHRKVWNFSLWRFWILIREKNQNWRFCRKVIVALSWNVGFPLVSPFSVKKKGSSTLIFQISQKYVFLKNAYSGISPGYAWRGYCKLFLCFLYSTWECELEDLHLFELPVLWAGVGRTRSNDVWSGCCSHNDNLTKGSFCINPDTPLRLGSETQAWKKELHNNWNQAFSDTVA